MFTCDGNDEDERLADNECYFMLLYGVQLALGYYFIYSETDDNDEDERLADNECYANGNPAGPFLPSKQGEQITTQNNTKHSQL